MFEVPFFLFSTVISFFKHLLLVFSQRFVASPGFFSSRCRCFHRRDAVLFLKSKQAPPNRKQARVWRLRLSLSAKTGTCQQKTRSIEKKNVFLSEILSQAKARKMSLAVLLRKPSYRLQCQREHEIELS